MALPFFNQVDVLPFCPRDLIFKPIVQEEKCTEELIIQHYLKPEYVVFDVGANAGAWSSSALYHHPGIRVIAFEPALSVFQHLDSVEFYNLALSDKQGWATFYFYTECSALSSLYNRACFTGKPIKEIEVELDTLDHFSLEHRIDRIDYLKIDAEGAELSILRGAQTLLREHRVTALQFEYGGCYEDAGTKLKEVASLLTEHGYVLFLMVPSGLMHIAKWHPCLENYQHTNYFAILASQVPEYPPLNSWGSRCP
jgi:FkbM family methyltransferase